QMSYLFGPRMYFPTTHGRIFPYAQALFGGDRLSSSISGLGSVSDNAFAMAIGGRADITLSKHVSLPAPPFCHFYSHFGGEGQNPFRIQSGMVYRFGRSHAPSLAAVSRSLKREKNRGGAACRVPFLVCLHFLRIGT